MALAAPEHKAAAHCRWGYSNQGRMPAALDSARLEASARVEVSRQLSQEQMAQTAAEGTSSLVLDRCDAGRLSNADAPLRTVPIGRVARRAHKQRADSSRTNARSS